MRILGIDVGKKNLGLCLVTDARPYAKIQRWQVVTLPGATAAEVYAGIRTVPEFFADVDVAVIERQPSKNPSMCRIQHYLEMYCAMLAVPVFVQDAKVKLAYAMTTPWWPHTADIHTYYNRKKAAVAVVDEFLGTSDQEPELIDVFRASKKRDDLADSFLHAAAYAAPCRVPGASLVVPKPTKLVARRPTPRQLASRKFSMSNLLWYYRQGELDGSPMRAAVRRHFGTLAAAETYFSA